MIIVLLVCFSDQISVDGDLTFVLHVFYFGKHSCFPGLSLAALVCGHLNKNCCGTLS